MIQIVPISQSLTLRYLHSFLCSDTEFMFSHEVIEDAISDIKLDYTPRPDGIPAILLKRCEASLCVPIYMLWSKSMSSRVVPHFYNTGYVTLLYKNYRPVTLTSHVFKVFERVVRKIMMLHLESKPTKYLPLISSLFRRRFFRTIKLLLVSMTYDPRM